MQSDRVLNSPLPYHLLKPFPTQQNFDSSKLKKFADDNFEFNENGRKLSKRVENTDGNGEIVHSAFPTLFSKGLYCRHVKRGLVWESVNRTTIF